MKKEIIDLAVKYYEQHKEQNKAAKAMAAYILKNKKQLALEMLVEACNQIVQYIHRAKREAVFDQKPPRQYGSVASVKALISSNAKSLLNFPLETGEILGERL